MWNLSLADIQRVKEELKGRRDALRAKYEDDVQALEADLGNIETLELAASLFVAKFRSEEAGEGTIAELTPAEPAPPGEPAASRNWRALLNRSEPATTEPR